MMRILLSVFALLGILSTTQCHPRASTDYGGTSPAHHYDSERGYPGSSSMAAKRYPADMTDNGYLQTPHKSAKSYPPADNDFDISENNGQIAHTNFNPYESGRDYPPRNDASEKGYPPNDDDSLIEYLRELVKAKEKSEETLASKEYEATFPPEPKPTVDTIAERYLELAANVADRYMEEFEADKRKAKKKKLKSSGQALSLFNHGGKNIQKLQALATREAVESETLALLTSGDEDLLREIHNVRVIARAENNPCNPNVDCNDKTNRNFLGDQEYRTINGICNNLIHPKNGIAGAPHRRLLENAYQNKIWAPRIYSNSSEGRRKVLLPSARNVSNVVHTSNENKPKNSHGLAISLFYFMQFIDHDLAKTPEGHVNEKSDCCNDKKTPKHCMPIRVDIPDDHFPTGYCMDARRSLAVEMCDGSGARNQLNEITSYMDASMVYGSTDGEMETLRAHIGGFLKESASQLMPDSDRPEELPCNVTEHEICFEAGDTRSNVHPGLATFHTVFVREHNRIVKELYKRRKDLTDEELFQEGRRIVSAMIQHIVYNEMLPIILDEDKLRFYHVSTQYTYNNKTDATMTQSFSMGYRIHHIMPDAMHIGQINNDGTVSNSESIRQEHVFMRPPYVTDRQYQGIDDITLGMVHSSCPHVDELMNNSTRNLLFLGAKGDSFDLVALNIMRGREWGLPSYTKFRAFCDFGEVESWDDLIGVMNENTLDKLKQVYPHVRDIDLWTGLVSEKPVGESIAGETQTCLLAKHFANIKHGDRFWYETTDPIIRFKDDQLSEIKKTTLARVLCSNLLVSQLRLNVFKDDSNWNPCRTIIRKNDINFDKWDITA